MILRFKMKLKAKACLHPVFAAQLMSMFLLLYFGFMFDRSSSLDSWVFVLKVLAVCLSFITICYPRHRLRTSSERRTDAAQAASSSWTFCCGLDALVLRFLLVGPSDDSAGAGRSLVHLLCIMFEDAALHGCTLNASGLRLI